MGLPATASDRLDDWTHSPVACLSALVTGAVLLFAVMIAVDPYDSGKFGWLGIDGVDDRDPHTASASRVRDAKFDSAVIGNSTAQILDPAELSQATGLRLVQLYLTSGLPRQQLAVTAAFLRHHPKPGDLVQVGGFDFEIRSMAGRRVERVRVVGRSKPAEEGTVER